MSDTLSDPGRRLTYDAGRSAFVARQAKDTNPYRFGTWNYRQWAKGWDDAQYADEVRRETSGEFDEDSGL